MNFKRIWFVGTRTLGMASKEDRIVREDTNHGYGELEDDWWGHEPWVRRRMLHGDLNHGIFYIRIRIQDQT